jgi:hypothetical protein
MTKLNLLPEQKGRLRQLAEIGNDNLFRFLGFSLDLETGDFHDVIQESSSTNVLELKDPTMHQQITELLSKYSQSNKTSRSGKLVKFKDFPGGYAYENAFTRRAIDPISKIFGKNPDELIKAANLLDGKRLGYGSASVEISALEGIPFTYILWTDEELPPSANILFDETASTFLNVEDIAGLAELTTWRLAIAKSILKSGNTTKNVE